MVENVNSWSFTDPETYQIKMNLVTSYISFSRYSTQFQSDKNRELIMLQLRIKMGFTFLGIFLLICYCGRPSFNFNPSLVAYSKISFSVYSILNYQEA